MIFFFFSCLPILAYSIICLEPISSVSMMHPVYFLDDQGRFDMKLLITLFILLFLTLSSYHWFYGHLCTAVQPGSMVLLLDSHPRRSSCCLNRLQFYKSHMLLCMCSPFCFSGIYPQVTSWEMACNRQTFLLLVFLFTQCLYST